MGDSNCARSSLFLINAFFLFAGLALLSFGLSWVQWEKDNYVGLADSNMDLNRAIVAISIGGLLQSSLVFFEVITSQRNAVLLWSIFCFLVLIFMIQIVAFAMGMSQRTKIEDEMHERMNKTLREYKTKGNGKITKAWDWAQQKFKCCGVYNYTDWRFSVTGFNKEDSLVPDSCCKVEYKGCGKFNQTGYFNVTSHVNKTEIYDGGCIHDVKKTIGDHLLTTGLATLAFLILGLVVVLFTPKLLLNKRSVETSGGYSGFV
ncbi:tetraspanin-11-like [Dendronephthya gigantea]|uniref:tetraspanin-11-like n=1 Tax=Dendronephthya gigantea TaxID=151771 RepID=UPI00106CF7D2|nr:tetraspanin-11-like [Dendronephthya gigantea]